MTVSKVSARDKARMLQQGADDSTSGIIPIIGTLFLLVMMIAVVSLLF